MGFQRGQRRGALNGRFRDGMKAFHADRFAVPLPAGHRFPIEKYRLLRERVAGFPDVELAEAPAASDAELERVHTPDYVRAVVEGTLTPTAQRRIGFPWSPGLVERSRRSVGATLAASRAALAEGVGASLAGGTHHAFADHGTGFCVFNDVAVAIRVLQGEGAIARAAVLDTDVHQGDGTAAIFAGDAGVFTCSLHGARNFPFRKQTSDLDLELADAAGDDEFLAALAQGLAALAAEPVDLCSTFPAPTPMKAIASGGCG